MAWSEPHLWTLGKFGLLRLLIASREGVVLAPHLVCPHLLYPQPKASQSLSPTRRNLRDGRGRGLAELQDGPGVEVRVQVEKARRECSGLHRCFCRSQATDLCPQLHLQPAPLWFAARAGPWPRGLAGGTSEWTVVGARLTMKDKREMDVGGEAEAGRKNGRRVCWKVECIVLTTGPDGPLVSPASTAVTEVTQAPSLVTRVHSGPQ